MIARLKSWEGLLLAAVVLIIAGSTPRCRRSS